MREISIVRPLKDIVVNGIVAAFLLVFVFINLKAFYSTGDVSYILVSVNEGVYVLLYLFRERAVATSTSGFDWSIALAATFFGTLLRPGVALAVPAGDTLIVLGTLGNIVSVLYLNKSISIVPAERSIKTAGPYAYVRHPMYASVILALLGYILVNSSAANILIAVGTILLILIRIEREELFLSRNNSYRTYLAKTPWKLIPFIY